MKKNKLLGIAIATLGVAISFGSAIALYTRAATNANFGISQGTYTGSTGTVTYKINGNTSGSIAPSYLKHDGTNGGLGLSAGEDGYDQVEYIFPLSATFAEDVTQQSYVAGNLAVSVTNIPSKWQGKLSIWVDVDGYGYYDENYNGHASHVHEDYYGYTTYRTAFMNSDYAITNENSSYSANRNIVVEASGVQSLRIFLKYDLTGLNNITLDEESLGYTLNVTWGAVSTTASNYEAPAYVVGNGNMWTDDDEYAMVRNIKATSAEWMYNNLKGTMAEAKCHIGDTWSSGDNEQLAADKTYDVYWNGSSSQAAYFDEL